MKTVKDEANHARKWSGPNFTRKRIDFGSEEKWLLGKIKRRKRLVLFFFKWIHKQFYNQTWTDIPWHSSSAQTKRFSNLILSWKTREILSSRCFIRNYPQFHTFQFRKNISRRKRICGIFILQWKDFIF